MTTPLSDERDLTNIDRLRIGALHVEPPFADEDLLDEITALESELERLRARNAELEDVDNRVQAMADRMAAQAADNLLRAREAERRVAKLEAVLRRHEWGPSRCLECYSVPPDHHIGCALDAALRGKETDDNATE